MFHYVTAVDTETMLSWWQAWPYQCL